MLFQSNLDIRHTLKVEGSNSPSELESCSTEIGVYLADHGNWPQPIFPDEQGCSRLLFVPPRFDVVGSFWTCNLEEKGECCCGSLLDLQQPGGER